MDEVIAQRWRKVLLRIARSFLMTASTVIAAYFSAPAVSTMLSLQEDELAIARLAALTLVAWGVLGRSGWEIQSWKGKSPPERFNRWWFEVLYVVGLYCGAVGILLEPVATT